jgi:hypothetical protein
MLIDIYVLAPERTASTVDRFLAKYVPEREQTAIDYEMPEYSNAPVAVFGTPDQPPFPSLLLSVHHRQPQY